MIYRELKFQEFYKSLNFVKNLDKSRKCFKIIQLNKN
jgi:hypothetical protein